jgi:hypothetical protein
MIRRVVKHVAIWLPEARDMPRFRPDCCITVLVLLASLGIMCAAVLYACLRDGR